MKQGAQTTDDAQPLVAPAGNGVRERVVRTVAMLALRVTLLVSPVPTVILLRRVFAAGGATAAAGLARHAPPPGAIESVLDARYGPEPDMLLDVHRPSSADGALPTVVWVHGGGWIGGSKEELADYCRLVAAAGYGVVAPRYSLAPDSRYPTPTRQVFQALAYVRRNATQLGLDPERIVVCGDSAGAQIAAQVGAVVTTPGYADAVGIEPTIDAGQLLGLVLACGPFDLGLLTTGRSADGRRLVRAVAWAYSGKRRFLDDPHFATLSVARHVSAAFPPVLVTVGNADPLRAHSELLVAELRDDGLEPETLFFPDDHQPPLGHEYQFDLDTPAGGLFFERMLDFLARRLAPQH
jgi:acetyl esterase/lipase